MFVRRRNLGGEGDMLNKIGSVRFNEGKHAEAIAYFEKALDIHRKVGNRSMEAEDLNDMAIAYRYLDDVWKSLPPLIDALEIHRTTGGRRLQAITMCNMANVYVSLGFLSPAKGLADDALRIAEEVRDFVVQSWALSWKAQALQAGGEHDSARPLFEDALVRARREGNPRSEAGILGLSPRGTSSTETRGRRSRCIRTPCRSWNATSFRRHSAERGSSTSEAGSMHSP